MSDSLEMIDLKIETTKQQVKTFQSVLALLKKQREVKVHAIDAQENRRVKV